jgi:hypothetical protein
MIRTAKEWAEVIAKIAEADPDQKIWVYCYTREDVEVYNSPEPDKRIGKGEWDNLLSEFERICDNHALEQIWEAFADATSSELGHLRCDDCYEYDYQVQGEPYEKKCAGCGEERDLLDQEPKIY